MAILKIARMGHPVLRAVAEPVADPTAPAVRALVADMLQTAEDANGTGLAAPQVHVSRRIVVFMVGAERLTERPLDQPQDWSVLINPVIEPFGTEVELGWEGCLSVPGLRGAVPRWTRFVIGASGSMAARSTAQSRAFMRVLSNMNAITLTAFSIRSG